jgi:hypothetical protein
VRGSDEELLRRLIALFNRILGPDDESFRAELERVWAPEPEIVPLRAALEGLSYRGPNAVDEFRAASMEAWSELQLELGDVEGEGPPYLCTGMLSGRGRESGAEFTAPVWIVVDIAGDRVTRVSTHLDEAGARAALGSL